LISCHSLVFTKSKINNLICIFKIKYLSQNKINECMGTLLIKNVKGLGGVLPQGVAMLKGKAMNEFKVIENAYLLAEEGIITSFGEMKDCPTDDFKTIDATDRYVLPAWCDSHTHLVFSHWREGEFMDKLNGLSYEEIAQKGGGILQSAKRLELATEAELLASAMERLNEIQDSGTGAVEIKSGYGLSVEGELKMLRVIKKLKKISPLTIKATFLGAHSYPMEFRQNHDGYLRLIEEEMLPVIAKEGLADYIDVFCEDGFFSADETDRLLKAGAKYGLSPKIHANELNYSGGIEVGVKNNALSVDHLECTDTAQIEALLASDTMPTVLPTTAFFLKLPYAPARKMIDAGLPLALASDYNPGSSPSGNLPFVISLASIHMKMQTAEALNACTINGAYAMGVEQVLGSITVGKKQTL
jgi:imidazolonepropionase